MKESITKAQLSQLDKLAHVADEIHKGLAGLAATAAAMLDVDDWDEQARDKIGDYFHCGARQPIETLVVEDLDVYVDDEQHP